METEQVTLERYKAEQALKSAESWFGWIGGLSILNSAIAMNGAEAQPIVPAGEMDAARPMTS
jgi:hypothetical protein